MRIFYNSLSNRQKYFKRCFHHCRSPLFIMCIFLEQTVIIPNSVSVSSKDDMYQLHYRHFQLYPSILLGITYLLTAQLYFNSRQCSHQTLLCPKSHNEIYIILYYPLHPLLYCKGANKIFFLHLALQIFLNVSNLLHETINLKSM